jgi:hypothetical protein
MTATIAMVAAEAAMPVDQAPPAVAVAVVALLL